MEKEDGIKKFTYAFSVIKQMIYQLQKNQLIKWNESVNKHNFWVSCLLDYLKS